MAGGAAVLVVVALLAGFVGVASAAPVTPSASATTAWAYGGTNSSSGTLKIGDTVITWNVTVAVDVIFNATPTVANTTAIQVQRTIAVDVLLTVTSPNLTGSFSVKGLEVDNGYANVTNASQVDASGTMVPALGLINSSVSAKASLNEALVGARDNASAFAYFNVSGGARGAVDFTPALGLIPLNLTGISSWNSTAIAHPSANWNFSYNYAYRGWNGTNGKGAATRIGAWNATGPVNLTGQVLSLPAAHFGDHAARTAILLMVTGPADLYDGFLIIPHGFDLFGGQRQVFDYASLSTSTITGDVVFVTAGHLHVMSFSAARVSFTSSDPPVTTATSSSGPVPATAPLSAGQGGSVLAQPESVSAAESQAHCLQFGCGSTGGWLSGLAGAALVGALIAVVVGTVGVVEWRSYSRRKTAKNQLVGGYSEGMGLGVPPGANQPIGPSTPPSVGGPESPNGPGPQH